MTRQCLSRRIEDIVLLRQELAAWECDRNKHTAYIQWHFTTDNARVKLVSLYPSFAANDENLIGRIFGVINEIAKKEKIDKSGFRVIMNCGEDAGQEVKHLHFHILAGKKLGTKII